MFQQFQNLRQNQQNPEEILKQMMSNYTPEQKQQFMNYANGFGITNDQLEKYGINTK